MIHTVVIGTQRSGTTVLRSALEAHPDFNAFGEVFLNRHAHMKDCYYHYLLKQVAENPEIAIPEQSRQEALFDGYLDYLAALRPEKKVVSYNCKYNFVMGALIPGEAHVDQPPFMLQQFWRRNFKVVHLIRNNLLAVHVSSLLSVANQVWATDSPDKLRRTIAVPTDNLIAVLEQKSHEQKYFKALINKRAALEIDYENLFTGTNFNAAVFAELSRFCDVDPAGFPTEPKYKKIARPLKDAIENLDEVRALLSNTRFSHFLD